jgi:hypothetical protein
MKPGDDRPSIGDIRTCLLSSIDFAEDLAHNRPEHAAAIGSFLENIRRVKRELMSSFEEGSTRSSLPDIVNGLTGARAMALIMAKHHPEKGDLLHGFVQSLNNIQEKLVRSIQPNLIS